MLLSKGVSAFLNLQLVFLFLFHPSLSTRLTRRNYSLVMSAVHSISSLQEAADRNRLVEEAMGRLEKGLGRWPHKDGMLGEEARTTAARHDLERLNESRIFISKTLDTRNLRQFKTELLRLLDNTPENPLSQYTYECNILRQLNYVESSLKSRIRRFAS